MLPSIVFYVFFAALSLYYEYKFYTSVETYEFRTKFLKLITFSDLSLFFPADNEGVFPYDPQTTWKPMEEYKEEPLDNSNTYSMLAKNYSEEITIPSRTTWVPTKSLDMIIDNEHGFHLISSLNLTMINNHVEEVLKSKNTNFLLHIIFFISASRVITFLTIRRLTFQLYHRHIFLESPRPCPRRVRRPRHPRHPQPRPRPRMATWNSLPQGPLPLPLGTRVEKQPNPEWEMRRYRWE